MWLRRADNTRVGNVGALSGWDQMRARIAGTEAGPMLAVFDTCRDFIRTVPVLQHDPMRLEDLDTSAEDQIADETRYACLARVFLPQMRTAAEAAEHRWRRDWPTAAPALWPVSFVFVFRLRRQACEASRDWP